jgi:hypothetical protein
MSFDQKTINALARLRHAAMNAPALSKVDFEVLDDAGVFAALDEQTDYASAEEILKDLKEAPLQGGRALDPSVWGDTTSADMARHQTRHGHAFTGTEGPDEMCIASQSCTVTYGEYVLHDPARH